MSEQRSSRPALPLARQAWPPPFTPDVADLLDAVLPAGVDEVNEILLACMPSAAPVVAGTAA